MRRAFVLVVIGVAILAGCGSTAVTPNPGLTPAPPADGWSYMAWADPALEIALPDGWTNGVPSGTTSPEARASFGPVQQRAVDWVDSLVAAGAARFWANGDIPTPLGPVGTGYVWVFVPRGDSTSLDAFAAAWMKRASDVGFSSITKTTVTLPAGVAAVVAFQGDYGAVWKFTQHDFLFVLPDGRGLVVQIGADASKVSNDVLDQFASRVIATLRPASP